jgi:hypothetical protein
MGEEYVSPIAKAIEARKRKVHEFDISGFFHLNGDAIPKLGVWVPVKGEQDAAIVRAHVDIANVTKAAETARSDEDILRDRKVVHILQKACLDPTPRPDPADPKKVFYYPAFPSPQWIADHLNTEQIGTLLNLVNGVRAKESPEPEALDDATVDAFHAAAVGPASYEITGEFLAGCGREFVCQLYVLEALRLEEARREIDELKAQVAKLTPAEAEDESVMQGGHPRGVEGDESSGEKAQL